MLGKTKLYRSLLVLVCSFSMTACAQNVKGERSTYQGFALYSDIQYGPDKAHSFDVYTRSDFSNAPVIFMVHGGAWKMGDKKSDSVVKNKVKRWVSSGFVFISANYRLVPHANPVEQAQDLREALVSAQNQVYQWGGNPDKFVLMGHSAGAHLVGLVSGSVSDVTSIGGKPWLGAILLDSAALDVPLVMDSDHYRFHDQAFGRDRDFWYQASPYHQLRSDARPILVTCSSKRKGACDQANKFVSKANSMGIKASVLSRNYSHKGMNTELGADNSYTQDVEGFMSGLDSHVNRVVVGSEKLSADSETQTGPVRKLIQRIKERRAQREE